MEQLAADEEEAKVAGPAEQTSAGPATRARRRRPRPPSFFRSLMHVQNVWEISCKTFLFSTIPVFVRNISGEVLKILFQQVSNQKVEIQLRSIMRCWKSPFRLHKRLQKVTMKNAQHPFRVCKRGEPANSRLNILNESVTHWIHHLTGNPYFQTESKTVGTARCSSNKRSAAGLSLSTNLRMLHNRKLSKSARKSQRF